MRPFSERQGFKEPKLDVQFDSMDKSLRISLFNAFHDAFHSGFDDLVFDFDLHDFYGLFKDVWGSFLKRPLNEMPRSLSEFFYDLEHWFSDAKWYRIYELLEFVLSILNGTSDYQHELKPFVQNLNAILQRERSGYLVLGNLFVPISNQIEAKEIEDALKDPDRLSGVTMHLKTALKHFSDKQEPDYRNVIKESISAVESLCKSITGDPKATLGKALDAIDKQEAVSIHKALLQGLDKIYGYTSDEQGIRHAMMEGSVSITQEDARFMIVSCSAFINYLIVKADKAGVKL